MEEVHIICLFPDINSLYSFQSFVYENMPPLKNRPEIFGRQIIMNSDDEETGECDKMLITACNISVVDVFSIVSDLGGTAYPAHIDRDSYSVLVNLGGVPDSYKGRYLELSYHLKNTSSRKRCGRDWKSVLDSLKEDGFCFIESSDAHYLGNILEPVSFIELEEKSVSCLIKNCPGKGKDET